MKILEAFELEGRGVIVVVPGFSEAPTGRYLTATITTSNGTTRRTTAHPENSRMKDLGGVAYLLVGLSKSEVVGGDLQIEVDE